MKSKPTKSEFASMNYLEDELSRYADGFPNSFTEAYYRALMDVKKAQRDNADTLLEIYKAVPNHGLDGSVEYGYYVANIHYYLFDSNGEFKKDSTYIDSLNHRILFLLDNADDLGDLYGWFFLNFPLTYQSFLSRFYDREVPKELRDMKDAESLVRFAKIIGDEDVKRIAAIIMEKIKTIRLSRRDESGQYQPEVYKIEIDEKTGLPILPRDGGWKDDGLI